ncbi:unnamed protein product [Lasius platythorax]|uniref:Uncharacterized protein n=1 Tax=Lasius platythorax TaxID=488582 RepID=A0AAV2NN20_9HYME
MLNIAILPARNLCADLMLIAIALSFNSNIETRWGDIEGILTSYKAARYDPLETLLCAPRERREYLLESFQDLRIGPYRNELGNRGQIASLMKLRSVRGSVNLDLTRVSGH